MNLLRLIVGFIVALILLIMIPIIIVGAIFTFLLLLLLTTPILLLILLILIFGFVSIGRGIIKVLIGAAAFALILFGALLLLAIIF